MQVKFKNTEQTFTSVGNNAVEQKLFRAGEVAGWMLSLSLISTQGSEELDAILTSDNISEITLTTEGQDTNETVVLAGYEKVTSCVVKYTDTKFVAEIQLTKGV